MSDVVAVAMAYALGCVQTGYYLVLALTGRDLRSIGSGATGARNAGRVLGWKGFVITLIVDAGKGALAVAVPVWMGASPITIALSLVAVTVGHVFPIHLWFSGGRGVAVGMGALAVFDIRLFGVLVAVTLCVWVVIRRFQAAGLAGFAAVPIAAWLLRHPPSALASVGGMSLIVLFAHRSRIADLLRCPLGADRGPSANIGD
ncbi:MAG: glycerol-3-phosphate acyltransferase [Kiritimatiellia bacterium]|nr:glycerol-3-phosphate acyltransferase [Kiritimatiellia bacterium]